MHDLVRKRELIYKLKGKASNYIRANEIGLDIILEISEKLNNRMYVYVI